MTIDITVIVTIMSISVKPACDCVLDIVIFVFWGDAKAVRLLFGQRRCHNKEGTRNIAVNGCVTYGLRTLVVRGGGGTPDEAVCLFGTQNHGPDIDVGPRP
jgi:hypothetical protein